MKKDNIPLAYSTGWQGFPASWQILNHSKPWSFFSHLKLLQIPNEPEETENLVARANYLNGKPNMNIIVTWYSRLVVSELCHRWHHVKREELMCKKIETSIHWVQIKNCVSPTRFTELGFTLMQESAEKSRVLSVRLFWIVTLAHNRCGNSACPEWYPLTSMKKSETIGRMFPYRSNTYFVCYPRPDITWKAWEGG